MATSASARHRTKRPYQSSIAAYFHRDSSDPKLERCAPSSSSPPLPADTQASLLSVGMRVRKSIPEGYKTHKTMSTPGFPFSSSAPARSLASAPSSHRSGSSGVEGLQPFCGLHKTGGWAQQPIARQTRFDLPPSSAPAVMERLHDENDEDVDISSLSVSRNTTPSTRGDLSMASSTVTSSPKRYFEEEIEDAMDAYFDECNSDEVASVASRRMAMPKSRLGRVAGSVGIADADDDFEDAEFLAPMDVDGACP